LRGLFSRAANDQDLANELDAHVQIATEEYVRRGMTPEEARRAALIASGGVESAKETYRDRRGIPALESIIRDVIFATRSLRKNRGFATTVVLTIALSIGATTAMFSIVKGVLLDPLPFGNGDRLVWTTNHGTRPYDSMSWSDMGDWGRLVPSFEMVGGWATSTATLESGTLDLHLSIAEVTDNWFSMLGVRPQIGRGFVHGEQGAGAPRVIVISDGLWRAEFAANPKIVGQTVLLDGSRYTVVGVAPPTFDFPKRIDAWRPVALDQNMMTCRGCRAFNGPIALLKRGATFERAQREARVVAAQLHAQFPVAEAGLSFDIQPLHDHVVGNTRTPLVILLAAVGALLMIACVNVAALLLVRATGRASELGIRLALGASRGRLAVQLLVESTLLAVAGGALGVVLAIGCVRLVVGEEVASIPLLANVGIDRGVLLFSCIVAAICGVGFGLMPAMQAGRTNVVEALRAGARGTTSARRAVITRTGLVALEIALVVPLLIGASLLSASFSRLVTSDPGFRPDHLVRFDIALPLCGTPWHADSTCAGVSGAHYNTFNQQRRFVDDLLGQLRAIPGVQSATSGFGAPFSDWAKQGGAIQIQGETRPGEINPVEAKEVKPGYFATLGTPILEGRDFTADDFRGRNDGCSRVAIVSKAAVTRYFGGRSPLGMQLTGLCDSTTTIIGVVGDMKTESLAAEPEPALYRSLDEAPVYLQTVFIRSKVDPNTVMAAARRAVASVDRSVAVFHMQTMRGAMNDAAAPARLAARIVSGFAISALLLALIGIYGLIAHVVRDRQRELGIRIALGAQPARVVALALRSGVIAVLVGGGAGVAVAFGASRVLRGLLYGIAPTDPATYAATSLALVVVSIVAAWIPGRQASRIDPLIAMRPE
jgi:putative ABC transport system permease protein